MWKALSGQYGFNFVLASSVSQYASANMLYDTNRKLKYDNGFKDYNNKNNPITFGITSGEQFLLNTLFVKVKRSSAENYFITTISYQKINQALSLSNKPTVSTDTITHDKNMSSIAFLK